MKQTKLLDTEVRWLSEGKAVERWAKQVREGNLMVTNGSEVYCGDRLVLYTRLSCYVLHLKLNAILYTSFASLETTKQNSKLQQPSIEATRVCFPHIPQAGGSRSVVLRPSESERVGQASCVTTGCPNDSDAPSGLGTPATSHTTRYVKPVISPSKLEMSIASSLNTFKKRRTSRSCSKLIQVKAQQSLIFYLEFLTWGDMKPI